MNQALYYILTPFLLSITLFGLIQMYLKETCGEALNAGMHSMPSIFIVIFN
jgi:ABC-type Na+ efflux pump permease subunit